MKVILFILIYIIILFVSSVDFNINNYDYIILLGAGLNNNRYSFQMLTRINRAVDYLLKYPNCKVIVTGGIVGKNTISEASVMNNMLLERHIKEDRIIIEDKATNTIENIKYSSTLINNKDSKILICSNDYHILRTKIICKKLGLNVKAISCSTSIFELIIHIPLEFIFSIISIFKKIS